MVGVDDADVFIVSKNGVIAVMFGILAMTPFLKTIKTSTSSTPTMRSLKRNNTSRIKGRRNHCQQHNSHNQTPKNSPKKSLKDNPRDESLESRRSSNHYPIAMIESCSEGEEEEDDDDKMLVLVKDDDRQHILDAPVMEQEAAEQSKQSAKRRKLINPSNPRQCRPKNYPREELFDRVIKGSMMKVRSRREAAFYGSFCKLNDDDDDDDIHTNVPEQEDYSSNDNSDESEGAQITFFSHYSEQDITEASKQNTKKRRRQKQIIPKILKRKLRQQQHSTHIPLCH